MREKPGTAPGSSEKTKRPDGMEESARHFWDLLLYLAGSDYIDGDPFDLAASKKEAEGGSKEREKGAVRRKKRTERNITKDF